MSPSRRNSAGNAVRKITEDAYDNSARRQDFTMGHKAIRLLERRALLSHYPTDWSNSLI